MEKTKYTLWTNPMDNWNKDFDDVEITPSIKNAVEKKLKSIDRKQLSKRIKAFTTPVRGETLIKIIGRP